MATNKKETEKAAPLGVSGRAEAETALAGAAYQKSAGVEQAEADLAAYRAKAPESYTSAYQEKIDAMLDKILNREGFSYDFSADPLYQAYKDSYTHTGRLAMQDAAAGAAAASGGYGSSYAASAGSQAYQGYLADLNGKLPELYETALARYQAEGNEMQDSLSALSAQEKAARSGYEDTVADYYKGLSAQSDAAEKAEKADYGAYQDRLDSLADLRDYYAGQENQQVKNEFSRQEYALALEKYEQSVRQWEAEQAAAQQKWQAQLSEDARQFDAEMSYKAAKASTVSKKATAKTATKTTAKSGTASEKTASGGDAGAAGSAKAAAKQKAGISVMVSRAAKNRLP